MRSIVSAKSIAPPAVRRYLHASRWISWPIDIWACTGRSLAEIGNDGDLGDPDGDWHEAYGVDADGAVLVRPDGHVAWRSRSGASRSQEVLRTVLDCLFGWTPAMA